MDRTLQQSFANSYPQRSRISTLNLPSNKIKEKYPQTKKRNLWKLILIVGLAALIYSSMAYTASNHIFNYFNIVMFNKDGEPSLLVQFIHSLLFAGIVYVILYSSFI